MIKNVGFILPKQTRYRTALRPDSNRIKLGYSTHLVKRHAYIPCTSYQFPTIPEIDSGRTAGEQPRKFDSKTLATFNFETTLGE